MASERERLREIDDVARTELDGNPLYDSPGYRSTSLRAPRRPLLLLPGSLSERTGPVFGEDAVLEGDSDLTRQHEGEPLGERITVTGRVLDRDGRPIGNTLVEIWQANAAGRYRHANDQHPAPLDPNFTGAGRCLTDGEGRYRFTTVKPGA
jgi:protocatechuate 3,4-dioxygenase beta subunit